MQPSDATAIISGGASGLGYATARRLVAAGARVAILELPSTNPDDRASELGDSAVGFGADVADEADVTAALEATVDALGPLRLAVNCAGIGLGRRTAGRHGPHPLSEFEHVLRVNLVGTFNLVRLAADVMARTEPDEAGERGVIVNTASAAAFEGQTGQAAYAASKAGIVGLTLPVARDLAPLRIRCVTVAPGTFDTPLLVSLSEDLRASLVENIPYPTRLGDPKEFAQLVLAIVENPYLNGETIRLDGALRMPPD